MKKLGMNNDEISSIYIPTKGGVSFLTIFQHDNYRGVSKKISSSIPCLIKSGFNDIISSIKVGGTKFEI